MKTYECTECGREITIEDEYEAVFDRHGNVFCDEACFVTFYTSKKDDFIDEEEEEEEEAEQ